jgi:hypothetical protein
MAKAETTRAKAPRGTRNVTAAFFSALDAIPEDSRAAVAKAAHAAIRDQLKAQREKAKAAKAKAAGTTGRRTGARTAAKPTARRTTRAPGRTRRNAAAETQAG